MSYCRAHLVSARRRVLVWKDPLAPDTGLHHRRIRRVGCVVVDRTDGTFGRDEKDVGVHSCNCGVAEKKSATRMAHAYRGENHASTGTLFCMEWRATRLRWCKNGTIHPRNCPDCFSGGPLISILAGHHKTRAGSFKLSQLAAQRFPTILSGAATPI